MSTKVKKKKKALKIIKAKLLSRRKLQGLENRNATNVGLTDEMIAMGGKTVSIEVCSIDGDTFGIIEDHGCFMWESMLFEPNKALKKVFGTNLTVNLGQEISGQSSATVNGAGDVRIGCTTVEFKTVEKLYRVALKARKAS